MLSIDGTGELEMDGHINGLERGDMFIAPSSGKVEYQYRANSPWWCVWFHLSNDAVWSKGLPAKGAIVRTPYVELLATIAEQYLTERTNRYPDSYAALEAYANLIVLILDREIRHLRVDRKENDLRLRLGSNLADGLRGSRLSLDHRPTGAAGVDVAVAIHARRQAFSQDYAESGPARLSDAARERHAFVHESHFGSHRRQRGLRDGIRSLPGVQATYRNESSRLSQEPVASKQGS